MIDWQGNCYYQFGAYQLQIELLRALFLDGEDKPPRLKKEDDQAWTLNALANSYAMSGQPRRAVQLREMQLTLMKKRMIRKSRHRGGERGRQQLVIGALAPQSATCAAALTYVARLRMNLKKPSVIRNWGSSFPIAARGRR
ncbi:MAG: hypothetical protein IPO22_14170 [Anaerolineales bacterium]|nr:hypothetical protein [Anaerolineales bacterium]